LHIAAECQDFSNGIGYALSQPGLECFFIVPRANTDAIGGDIHEPAVGGWTGIRIRHHRAAAEIEHVRPIDERVALRSTKT
jgi:hypothetical protein